MKNRITELFNIKYPIALGGMAGVTDAKLAAAVSEAGVSVQLPAPRSLPKA